MRFEFVIVNDHTYRFVLVSVSLNKLEVLIVVSYTRVILLEERSFNSLGILVIWITFMIDGCAF